MRRAYSLNLLTLLAGEGFFVIMRPILLKSCKPKKYVTEFKGIFDPDGVCKAAKTQVHWPDMNGQSNAVQKSVHRRIAGTDRVFQPKSEIFCSCRRSGEFVDAFGRKETARL